MPRYFCHIHNTTAAFDDRHGFHAADDIEAIGIARAVALILIKSDPAVANAVMRLQSEDGAVLFSTTLNVAAGSM